MMKYCSFIAILIVLFFTSSTHAQWQQLTSLEGGIVYCAESTPSGLFAGTTGGIYFSADSGVTWIVRNNGLPTKYSPISCLASYGNDIYAGCDGGIFISSDDGLTWTSLNSNIGNLNISSIAVSGTNIYCGTDSGVNFGLYHSSDSGVSWSKITAPGAPPSVVKCVEIAGNYVFAGAGTGIHVSPDNGVTWSNFLTSNVNVTSILVIDSVIMAATQSDGAYRSVNMGASWANSYCCSQVYAMTFIDSTIFISIGNNIKKSINLGATWITAVVSPGFKTDGFAKMGDTIFACSSTGVHRSLDSTATWTLYTSGMCINKIVSIYSAGSRVVAGAYPGHVIYSSDTGATFNPVNGMSTAPVTTSYLLYDDTSFFASTGDTYEPMYLSSDTGITWVAKSNGMYGGVGMMVKSDTVIIANAYQDIYMTNDHGNVWIPWNIGIVSTPISRFESTDSLVYAATPIGVYTSNNDGLSWVFKTNLALPSMSQNVFGLTYHDSVLYAGTRYGVYASYDHGDVWYLKNNQFPDWVMQLEFVGELLVGRIKNNGLYYSLDYGITWSTLNSGLMDYRVNIFSHDSINMYAGTEGSSIYRIAISNLPNGIGSIDNILDFNIFPNPSTGLVNITLNDEIKKGTYTLFSVLGQQLYTNTIRNEDHIILNCENYTPGTYYIRIEDGQKIATKKVIIM